MFKLQRIIASWDEVKYVVSTWPGIVNVDLFAPRNLLRCVSVGGGNWWHYVWRRYWHTLFWLAGRVEPNAMIYFECWTRPTTAFELLFAYALAHRVVRLFIFTIVFSAFLLLLLIKEQRWDLRPHPLFAIKLSRHVSANSFVNFQMLLTLGVRELKFASMEAPFALTKFHLDGMEGTEECVEPR